MKAKETYKLLTYFIALVWFVNGFFCKVLNLVPRHEEIVGRVISEDIARFLTIVIGFAEIIMAIWILSGYKSKFNAILQIIIIITMNALEFMIVPDLLLWGKLNSLFALLFILLIYYNEFVLHKKIELTSTL